MNTINVSILLLCIVIIGASCRPRTGPVIINNTEAAIEYEIGLDGGERCRGIVDQGDIVWLYQRIDALAEFANIYQHNKLLFSFNNLELRLLLGDLKKYSKKDDKIIMILLIDQSGVKVISKKELDIWMKKQPTGGRSEPSREGASRRSHGGDAPN